MNTDSIPDVWAVVELMGHVRLGGRLSEEEKFSVKLGRLDIPHDDGFVTQYFGGASVYRITVVTEEVARAVATRTPAPVQPWELPKQLREAATPRHPVADELYESGDSLEDDRS